ncbi:MAG: hypothetical protein AB1633_00435 [Elusimicrobiota bacterium]
MSDKKNDWNGRERRKKIIIDKRIQLRHIGLLAVSFILILVLVEVHIYSLMKSMIPKGALDQDYGYLTSLGLIIMIEMLVIIFIVGIINIIFTHRIVGPVSRIEQELYIMIEKNEFHNISIRENDELKTLVIEINRLIDKIKK